MSKTRASGVAVDPLRVRRARQEAGLTLAALAGSDVSRAFISQVEHGLARPSRRVLRLISRRTGKPMPYFEVSGQRKSASRELSEVLTATARQVRRFIAKSRLSTTEREAMKMVESSIRRAVAVTLSIKSKG